MWIWYILEDGEGGGNSLFS